MWRWVFLDVGNVLLDEDPLTYLCFLRHAEAVARVHPEVTFDAFLALREARAAAGSRWPLYEAAAGLLGTDGCAAVWEATAREVRARFAELSPPIPGAGELLEALAGFARLGVVANQGPECRARLAALGWLDRFEVVCFSEEHGCAKPDLRLFRQALSEARVRPSESLMVGDRLDNDVAPASALGMATAWVRWPDRSAKGWRPEDPRALAYRASLDRSNASAPDHAPRIRPTLVCDEIGQLARLLRPARGAETSGAGFLSERLP